MDSKDYSELCRLYISKIGSGISRIASKGKSIARRASLDMVIAATIVSSILPSCNNIDNNYMDTNGNTKEIFYAQKRSSEKKVFIYDQGLADNDIADSTLNVADYMLPHLYAIEMHRFDLKVTKEKTSRKERKGKSIHKNVYSKTYVKPHIDIQTRAGKKTIESFLARAREDSVYVTPMVSAFDKDVILEVLDNPQIYASMIAERIKSSHTQGVSIDFESVKIDSRESDKLVKFMKILRDDLPKPYVISVAVSPRFIGSSDKGFSHHGFYDYRGLSEYVDYMNLMCYDFHKGKKTPSPVMPESMLLKVLNYASDNIPREKIVPLLPFYGFAWKRMSHKHKTKHGANINYTYKNKGVLSSKNDTVYKDTIILRTDYMDGEKRVITKNRVIYEQDSEVYNRRFEILDSLGISNVGGWREQHASYEILNSINTWKRKNSTQ